MVLIIPNFNIINPKQDGLLARNGKTLDKTANEWDIKINVGVCVRQTQRRKTSRKTAESKQIEV